MQSLPGSWWRRRELSRQTDEELVGLVAEHGDTDAFQVIYDRHCDVAFSLAMRMCGRRQAAEDVAQEAFMSVWRGARGYRRDRGSVRGWVLGIVHNAAVDWLRRSATRDGRLEYDDEIAVGMAATQRTEEQVEHRDEAQRVRDALDRLPREQRTVIELAYFGGFTQLEIAEILQTPIGTVKGRLRLGLSRLRIALDDGRRDLEVPLR